MCAQFTIKVPLSSLASLFDAMLVSSGDQPIREKILPHQMSPVVYAEQDQRVVREMNFSLIPSWSKTARPKFATHNARVESLLEKPTWRGPVGRSRALVPLSSFIEPVYSGQFSGNMVVFTPVSDDVLVAAALYDRWVDAVSGDTLFSFSIVTGEPGSFVRQVGHDRQPIFLQKNAWAEWLDPKLTDGDTALAVLQRYACTPQLQAHVDRGLKPGWEKRRNA